MGRYLKFIGFLVLAFIVWQTSGAAFADGSSAGAEESMDIRTAPVAAHHQEALVQRKMQIIIILVLLDNLFIN